MQNIKKKLKEVASQLNKVQELLSTNNFDEAFNQLYSAQAICNETINNLDANSNDDNINEQHSFQNYRYYEYNLYDQPIVEIKNLTKKYSSRKDPTLNNISFNIYPGQFHALIGANGAGKTTAIKCIISGYSEKKYDGEIMIGGHKNNTISAKKLVGYIPENAKFPSNLNTRDYLYLMTVMSGYKKNDAKKIVDDIIKKLNIEQLANKKPGSFSSGQKKKILLAQALVHNPQVLIMDEPAANLDPPSRIELFDTLLSLQKEGKAIFISSHILDELTKYTTYVTIIDGGNISFSGPVEPNQDLTNIYKEFVVVGSLDNKIIDNRVKNNN